MSNFHLVMPDAHAKPGINNKRFKAAGNMIMELRPTQFICLGDFACMPSLCSYDKGKKSFEGRRYKADVDSCIDALKELFKPLIRHNKKRIAWKKSKYNPECIIVLGNHEHRINRAIEEDSRLDGTIGIEDLKFGEYFDEVVPFLTPKIVDGVAYSHYFTSGVMGRPISGKHQAMSLLDKMHMSCTQGHTHTMDWAEQLKGDGTKIIGHVAGCYFDHNEDWAGKRS